MDLDELYEEIILDYSKRPRNFGQLPPPATHGEGFNPSCGDEVVVYVQGSEDQRITDIRFEAQACAICTASSSLMTTRVKGLTVSQARALQKAFLTFLTTQAETSELLGNLRVLAGVKRFPQRLKCATLGWHALTAALDQCDSSDKGED
ncbi:MAG: SUF system NifU family Fe-S cluster assembly protein [Verrucomicrobia bacterium]|nr:SUF system NifU family Fe-S cluster assembly protein [Verrucomicrobiota bacterium]